MKAIAILFIGLLGSCAAADADDSSPTAASGRADGATSRGFDILLSFGPRPTAAQTGPKTIETKLRESFPDPDNMRLKMGECTAMTSCSRQTVSGNAILHIKVPPGATDLTVAIGPVSSEDAAADYVFTVRPPTSTSAQSAPKGSAQPATTGPAYPDTGRTNTSGIGNRNEDPTFGGGK
jgi:hypothetical protein